MCGRGSLLLSNNKSSSYCVTEDTEHTENCNCFSRRKAKGTKNTKKCLGTTFPGWATLKRKLLSAERC